MAMATLKATKRDALGTHKVKRLREQGLIPAIIYGHGETPVAVAVANRDAEIVVHKGSRLLQLEIDGQNQHVLIKAVQYDNFGHELMHMDFARVRLDERVHVTVPIVLRGKPVAGEEAGVLQQITAAVAIECLVTAIPDDIRVSVAEMKVGDVIKAKELALPEGAKLLIDGEILICSVTIVTEVEEAVVAPVEGAAEPEVIREKKEEEEGEGEAGAKAPAAKAEKKE